MTDESPNRAINVSEDRMRGVIAEFEIRFRDWLELKLAHKADLVMLEMAQKDIAALRDDVGSLKEWRSNSASVDRERGRVSAKQIVWWGLGVTLFAGVLSAVATLVWLAAGG